MNDLLSGGAGLLAGALSGVFGIGGGVVLVPLLALTLGLDQHDAQGVTLAIMLLPIGAAAVVEYHRVGAVRWPLVVPMIVGFMAGIWLGSEIATAIPERPLRLGFVAFMLAMAARSFWSSKVGRPAGPPPSPRMALLHATWIGAAGGVASGLLGIGGGVVMIPLMVSILALTQHEAQGTSLATMLPPIGLPGVLVYARASGGLPWVAMAVVATGFVGGGALGARIANRLRGPGLTRAFGVFVACVACALLWRALRI